MEIFPEGRTIYVKTKQANKNFCISNTKKGSKEYPKIRFVKIKGPVLLHLPFLLILKVLQKFREKGKIAILIVSFLKCQIWTSLLKDLNISTIPLKKHLVIY
jgi:hypothetical protein